MILMAERVTMVMRLWLTSNRIGSSGLLVLFSFLFALNKIWKCLRPCGFCFWLLSLNRMQLNPQPSIIFYFVWDLQSLEAGWCVGLDRSRHFGRLFLGFLSNVLALLIIFFMTSWLFWAIVLRLCDNWIPSRFIRKFVRWFWLVLIIHFLNSPPAHLVNLKLESWFLWWYSQAGLRQKLLFLLL